MGDAWYTKHIFDYFSFPKSVTESVPESNVNISGKCKLCNKLQSGWINVNSYFRRHVVIYHINLSTAVYITSL